MGFPGEGASDEKTAFKEWPDLMKLGAEPNAKPMLKYRGLVEDAGAK